LGNSDQWSAQIALHVHGQSLNRRNVQHPATLVLLWRRRKHQPVDAPQEGGQRLARSRGRQNQSGLAASDRRPSPELWLGRRGKNRFEPFAYRGVEQAGI
jgi:hypothetical protein